MGERVSDQLLSTCADEKGKGGFGGELEWWGERGTEGVLFLLSCYGLLDLGSF